jgi:hypothetical protein
MSSRPSTPIARGLDVLRREGVRGLVLHLLYYLGVYRRFRIHLSPLEAEWPCSVPVACDILGVDDIHEYLEIAARSGPS